MRGGGGLYGGLPHQPNPHSGADTALREDFYGDNHLPYGERHFHRGKRPAAGGGTELPGQDQQGEPVCGGLWQQGAGGGGGRQGKAPHRADPGSRYRGGAAGQGGFLQPYRL